MLRYGVADTKVAVGGCFDRIGGEAASRHCGPTDFNRFDRKGRDGCYGNASHLHRRTAQDGRWAPSSHRARGRGRGLALGQRRRGGLDRSEEHTSELQSLMRISYAVFCLKTKKIDTSR